jgi:hypothetical protein
MNANNANNERDHVDMSQDDSGQGHSRESNSHTVTTTIVDHVQERPEHSNHCVVYKFRSRPPYEGFILILVIVLITALLIWWLNSKFTSD